MGIPKFFRWLVRRYPLILADIKTEDDVPPIDNLYLDLNGVIHNATHSNDPKKLERISKAKDFEIIWAEVVQYIDDIIHLVKPREMCMFAVDGVAPRAKMNQQRSRRFKTAQERHELKRLAEDAVIEQDTELSVGDMFDVNSISPGTDFMTELNKKLDYFIQHKINTDPVYSNIKIILSGSDVPGEGEHKIMEYIRWYKNSDVYKKDTRHCIYGQDADLIMLSLLSHEPNFTIIREEVKYKREQVEGIVRNEFILTNNFQLLYLPILRQYLDLEFKPVIEQLEFDYNLERVIDDIIFLCFFIGNDFLPSLSVLDIAEASVDTLFEIYKNALPEIGDYITENGLIFWDRAENLIKALATHELSILHSRMQKIMNFEKRAEHQEAQFFKGVERVQYFKLKEKKAQMIHGKKKRLLDRLVEEGRDKEYKENKVANRPRELVKMQLDVKTKDTALKKRRANNPTQYKSNNSKFDFGVLMENGSDEEEKDLDWLDDDDRGEADDADEGHLRNQEGPTNTKMESKEETKTAEPTPESSQNLDEEEKEETVDTSKTKPKDIEKAAAIDALSDLDIKDFNDSDVSSVDLEELAEIEGEVQGTLSKELIVQLKIAEESRKKNQSFVKNLCERYKENPASAKAYYYKEKLNFDVKTEEGAENRDEMLRQYLIGMQWVLFYYYKGVKHWGFYYKYHYPPMISDIKDVETLLGRTTIESFDEIDSENRPFFPFEQLLTILPPDSIQNLLPQCYHENFIDNPKFKEFYPLTFDMDLNGKSMPWEAIVLIPFIDEKVLLNYERELAEEGKLQMEQKDIDRNKRGIEKVFMKNKSLNSFDVPEPEFKGFSFGDKNRCKVVEQPPENEDYIGVHSIDYKTTDTHIVCDFPSINNLEVEKMTLVPRDHKGTIFEIPQLYMSEAKIDEIDLDKLAKDFVTRKRDAVYIDYPFLHEAFIFVIVTYEAYYNVYDCWCQHSTKGLVSETTEQQYYEATSFCNKSITRSNIHCPNIKVIIGFNRVEKVRFNNTTNSYDKIYKNEVEYLPLQMVALERDPAHYENLDPRISDPLSRFETMKRCMILDDTYFGICAQIKKPTDDGEVNEKFRYYDVTINNRREQKRCKDVFFAKNIAKELQIKEPVYSSIDHICKRHRRSFQAVNRITSSIFVKYVEHGEKKTVDIGLKLRNNNQKLHIPFDVIYTEKFNKFKSEPVQCWSFSAKAEEVIIDYLNTFEWLEHYVDARAHHEASNRHSKYSKSDNRMNTLEDAMPFYESDELRLEELKRLTDYLDACELTHRSFVPAGFRFLSTDTRNAIERSLSEKLTEEQKEIPTELIKVDPRKIFVEVFPFWSPHIEQPYKSFRYGDRVVNINTTRRKYIPFGEIGTVVGLTLDSIIVRFDEPNVSLTDVHDTCPPYTGAVVKPESLINLTYFTELTIQSKRTNIRNPGPSKAGNFQKQGPPKNFREGGYQKQGYKGQRQGPGHSGTNEETKHAGGNPGFTSYGGYNPKKAKKNYNKGYDY